MSTSQGSPTADAAAAAGDPGDSAAADDADAGGGGGGGGPGGAIAAVVVVLLLCAAAVAFATYYKTQSGTWPCRSTGSCRQPCNNDGRRAFRFPLLAYTYTSWGVPAGKPANPKELPHPRCVYPAALFRRRQCLAWQRRAACQCKGKRHPYGDQPGGGGRGAFEDARPVARMLRLPWSMCVVHVRAPPDGRRVQARAGGDEIDTEETALPLAWWRLTSPTPYPPAAVTRGYYAFHLRRVAWPGLSAGT